MAGHPLDPDPAPSSSPDPPIRSRRPQRPRFRFGFGWVMLVFTALSGSFAGAAYLYRAAHGEVSDQARGILYALVAPIALVMVLRVLWWLQTLFSGRQKKSRTRRIREE